MIVDTGKVPLLASQISYFGTLSWVLFDSNTTITAATTFGALSFAGWSGYVAVVASPWSTPVVPTPGGPAVTNQTTLPIFTNTSGSTVTFYGFALVDLAASILIAAVNLGLQSIPNGGNYVLAPAITDDQL